ncbi:dipeptidase 1-like [Hydractinia symbiolongicarpus]|uniref:dipeptidase 1-like n=1 Tax=Hydractinia symbiolongicarpus TaxID=13093 RepID=UPI00254BD22C|nr:dipeptidase 1-like [Hydractinia symbiolongicarpus]
MTPRQRAYRVLENYPLVDGHNDLPWQIRTAYKNQLCDVSTLGGCHTSIPKLRRGKVGAQFWAAFMLCDTQEKDAIRNVLEQMDLIKRITRQYSSTFDFVTTADGIVRAHRRGKIASLIGVEGGHAIDSSMAVLRSLYDLGARYMTITHSCNTPWADNWKADNTNPNITDPARSDGLSPFGKEVIKEMNRLGMMIDLAHVSHRTMEVVLKTTSSPIMFSHSSAFSVCNNNRNVRDDILLKVKQNGGVVMVNFYVGYVNCGENKTNETGIDNLLEHINYIKNFIGSEYVGLGSDYDGVPEVPIGLEDVSKFPEILVKLAEQGWTDYELRNLAGGNIIRVFKKVERISRWMLGKQPSEMLMQPSQFLNVNNTCRAHWLENIIPGNFF